MDSLVEKAPVATPNTTPGLQAGLTPTVLLMQLRRAAVPIAICAILGAGGAFLYARTLPKSFSADGVVAVESDHLAIPELQGALRADESPDPLPLVHTEVQALSARQLVQTVSNQMHLERDPEFNGALRKPGAMDRVTYWFKSFLPSASKEADNNPNAATDSVLNSVAHNLTISQDNRSLVIGVSFHAHEPDVAAKFVNTLIDDYIESRAQRRVTADAGASAVVSQRIEQVRADIEHIEQQMRDLREKSGLVGTRAGSVGQQQVEDLATAASQATLQRSQIEANWERASALASGGSSDALASVLGSETISRLREQESVAAEKVADLQQRYGSNYPALRSAEADLSATRREISSETRRIVDSLATQLRVARAHEADVNAQLMHARQAGVAAQNTQAQLDQLQQDAATRRDLYRTLLERAQQTETSPKSAVTPDVRVLSKATPPGLPSAPNVKMATAFGGLGGGLLACMVALAFTRVGGGRTDAPSFARAAGLHVVGTLKNRAGRALAERLVQSGVGPEADAMRAARGRLGQLSRTPPRVVGFVGAQAGLAATAAACAYARTAARDGQRVLIIDQDPASGAMARVLGDTGGRLGDAMSGAASWRDCVSVDRVPGLDTLVASAKPQADVPRNIVGLENLLAEARSDYDLIILGAAGTGEVDATRIVRSSDVTVVVLEESTMRARPAAEAIARLRSFSRSPLAAFLLTRA
jgi:uncharacterized protein involved in exopolysaccharide biosynthesis/Mrp family chromosome partitioning ATPase